MASGAAGPGLPSSSFAARLSVSLVCVSDSMRRPLPSSPRPESPGAGRQTRPDAQLVCLALTLAVLALAARIVSVL